MKKTISVMLIMVLLLSQTVFAATFTDTGNVAWAIDEIEALAEMGVINGRGDGIFAPGDNVTREEFAKMLALTFEMDIDENAITRYSDVDNSGWSAKYIAASDKYIVPVTDIHREELVYSSFRYGPRRPATRFEIAVAIAKALGYDGGSEYDEAFTDSADIPEKYTDYIAFAVEAGIIEGYPDGSFRPYDNVTRAECAVMLYRAINLDTEPEASATPDVSATPEVSATPTPTGIPTIPPGHHVAVVKSVSKVMLNDEIYTKLTVCFGGTADEVELYTDEDTKIMGVKSDISHLAAGDTFIFSYYLSSNALAYVYVMFSAEQAIAFDGDDYTSLLSLPKGTNYGDYGLFDDGSTACLYYGKLILARDMSTGLLITLQGSADDEVDVYVPKYLPVLLDTVRSGSKNHRFSSGTTADFKDNRNKTFVFVRTKDQETIDAVIFYFE